MRYLNRALAWLRSGAKTVGLSPKILAPAIATGLVAVLAAVGLSPHDLGQLVGVSDAVAAGAVLTVAGSAAAWLLGPGTVVAPAPDVGVGSDARMPPHAREQIGR